MRPPVLSFSGAVAEVRTANWRLGEPRIGRSTALAFGPNVLRLRCVGERVSGVVPQLLWGSVQAHKCRVPGAFLPCR